MADATPTVRRRPAWLFPRGAASAALLVAGIYCLLRGIGYLPVGGSTVENLPSGLSLLTNVIPIEGWGAAWAVVGVVVCIRSFSYNDALAWGVVVGMMVIWGLGYSVGWIMSVVDGAPNREWLSMSSYLGPAIIIGLLSAVTKRI